MNKMSILILNALVAVFLVGCNSSDSNKNKTEPSSGDTETSEVVTPETGLEVEPLTYNELIELSSANNLAIDYGYFYGRPGVELVPMRDSYNSPDVGDEFYVVGSYLNKLIQDNLSDADGKPVFDESLLVGKFEVNDNRLAPIVGYLGLNLPTSVFSIKSLDGYFESGVSHEDFFYGSYDFDLLVNHVYLAVDENGKLRDVYVEAEISNNGETKTVDYNFSNHQYQKTVIFEKEKVKTSGNLDVVEMPAGVREAAIKDYLNPLTNTALKPYWENMCEAPDVNSDGLFLLPSSEEQDLVYEQNEIYAPFALDDLTYLREEMLKESLVVLSAYYHVNKHTGSTDNEIISKIQSFGRTKNTMTLQIMSLGDVTIHCNTSEVRNNY